MAVTRVNGSVTYNPTRYEYYFTWEETNIDTVANTSDVTVRVYARRTSTYQSYTSAGTSQIQIDGTNSTKDTGLTVDLQTNQTAQLLDTYTRTITHNADGSKQIVIKTGEAVASGSGIIGVNDSSYSPYKGTATGTITLTTIPREAYVSDSAPTFVIGNDLTVNIVNAGGLYVRVKTYINGVLKKTEDLDDISGSVALDLSTVASSIYAECPNALSVAGQLVVQTFSDAIYTTQVGVDKTKDITATVNQTTNKPTFTTASIANVDKSVAITDSYGDTFKVSSTHTLVGSNTARAIKGYNKIRATIAVANKAVALNSATMSKYRFVENVVGAVPVEASYSAVADVNIDLNNVNNNSFIVSAIDSRTLQTNISNLTLTVFTNYFNISAWGLTLTRQNLVDAPVTMVFNGLMFKGYFGGGTNGTDNTLTAKYRYKETTASDWTTSVGTATISNATPAVVTKTTHGLVTGDQVWFTTTGSLPTGLTPNTHYYVYKINNDTFNVCPTYADAIAGTNKIATSSAGSGTHTAKRYVAYATITPTVDGSGNISFNSTVNGDLGASGFTATKAFNVEVVLYDELSYITLTGIIDNGTPLMDLTQTGVAIKGRHTGDAYALEVNGDTNIIGGDLFRNGTALQDTLNAIPTVGRLLGMSVLTSASANFTTSANTNKILVYVQAGGGGGGGVANTSASQLSCAKGGGAGGLAIKLFTVSPSTAYAYTCGVAGTAGANTGGAGGNGGNSTFVVGGTTVTAYGGTGGASQSTGTGTAVNVGGAGGAISTNGDINRGGAQGGSNDRRSGTVGMSGKGADSFFGAGGGGIDASTSAGNNAKGYGAGGGGAISSNAGGARAGGVGGAGCILVFEYA